MITLSKINRLSDKYSLHAVTVVGPIATLYKTR